MRTAGACLLLRRESGSLAALASYPVSLLFATDPSEFARNSFAYNRSGKQGVGGVPSGKQQSYRSGKSETGAWRGAKNDTRQASTDFT